MRLEAKAIEPNDVAIGAKPSELALGILPGLELALGDRLADGKAPAEDIQGLLVTKRL